MFKKIHYIIFVSLSLLIVGATTIQHQKTTADTRQRISTVRMIIDEAGRTSSSLEELLTIFDINCYQTLSSIVVETQKKFKRAEGKERWQMDELFLDKREQAWDLLQNLGLINEIYPSEQYYDYAVLLGATLPTMRSRVNHVRDLWNRGIRFNKLVFLGGQRPLDRQREPAELMINDPKFIRADWKFIGHLPTTEIEMMKMVYDQTALPQELKKIPVLFIDTPMQKQIDGSVKRPTTADTVHHWLHDDTSLKEMTMPHVLVISSQPHVGYQDTVMRTLLPRSFIIDTVGSADDPTSTTLAEILDAIARWLYQEQERRKLS